MSLLEQPQFAAHLDTLRARWENALEATSFGAVVVSAGASTNYFMDDQAPPYRPNPHFAQWFPDSNCEHCELLLTSGQDPLLLFYQPEDYWHMPPQVPAWASENFRVESHSSVETLAAARNRHLKGHNQIGWLGPQPPADPATNALVGDHLNPAALVAHLDFLRCQKTPFEVAAIREATRHAVTGHLAARDAFFAGASEYQMYMAFLAATGNTGAQLPYSSIVALNEHAGVLHYQHYDATTPAAHLSFLIDAGASHLGYASDITRTYCSADTSGSAKIAGQSQHAPAEFAQLIAELDSRQQQLIADIRVGTPYADLHGAMIDTIAELLCSSGVLQCSADEAISRRYADPFMPHGLGHLIGLQTHDVGGQIADLTGTPAPPDERFPALRLTRPLEADAVFTIEPGIYFIPMLLDALRPLDTPINWRLVDQLMPCGGIRIEDNIWLTNDGPVNLTREAFAAA